VSEAAALLLITKKLGEPLYTSEQVYGWKDWGLPYLKTLEYFFLTEISGPSFPHTITVEKIKLVTSPALPAMLGRKLLHCVHCWDD
jgi:hypothetical protein